MKEFEHVLSMVKRHNTVMLSSLEIKRIKAYIKKSEKQILEVINNNNADFLEIEKFRNNKKIVIKAMEIAIVF